MSKDAKQEAKKPELDLMKAPELASDERAELARLREENAKLKAVGGQGSKRELPEKYRGTKTYRIGPAGHYRLGRSYLPGETITVTDEVPSKTWTPVDNDGVKVKPVFDEDVPAGRLSDQSI